MSAAARPRTEERSDLTNDAGQQPSAVRATARGGAGNVVGAATTALLNLLIVVAVTRGYDKAIAGTVFTATAVYVVVEAIVKLGTDIGIVHFVSTAQARDERERVAQHLWAWLVPVAVVSVIGAAVTYVAAPVLMRAIGTAGAEHSDRTIVLVVAIGIPIGAIYDCLTAATRGMGRARPTVLVERTLRPVLQAGGVLAAALVGASTSVVVFAWVAPYAVVLPIMGVLLVRLMRREGVPRYSAPAAVLGEGGESPCRGRSPASSRSSCSGWTSSWSARSWVRRPPRSTPVRPGSSWSGSWATRASPSRSSRSWLVWSRPGSSTPAGICIGCPRRGSPG